MSVSNEMSEWIKLSEEKQIKTRRVIWVYLTKLRAG